jgi:hypothetical protein
MIPLTQAELQEYLHYNPLTGVFIWLEALSRNMPPGDIAGTNNHRGYRIISIYGRKYQAHRLAWLYTHGTWPKDQIDHINGNGLDNRIANLREATAHQNSSNVKLPKDNTSHFRGVVWHRRVKKWQAQISVRGVTKYLGCFPTPEAASAVYEAKATEIFGEFKRK